VRCRVIKGLIAKATHRAPIVVYQSSFQNIFHCCAHKTGSQWVRAIMSDERIHSYSGLKFYFAEQGFPDGYDPRKVKEKSFETPFPPFTIVGPLYLDFENFEKIPKPDKYTGFFVTRDPRDIVVSYYFSVKYSHTPIGNVAEMRNHLINLDPSQGFIYVMEDLEDYGTFHALRSWAEGIQQDSAMMLVRYEDLVGNNSAEVFKQLFSFCDVGLSEEKIDELIDKYSFKNLSGRHIGNEDKAAHYRKGVPGDWVNYFDKKVMERFKQITGDLVSIMGYD
jgi:hypothetical protein